MFMITDGPGGNGVYSEECIRCRKPYRVALPVALYLKWQSSTNKQKPETLFRKLKEEDRNFLSSQVCPRCERKAEAAKLPLAERIRTRLTLFWQGAKAI